MDIRTRLTPLEVIELILRDQQDLYLTPDDLIEGQIHKTYKILRNWGFDAGGTYAEMWVKS